MGCATSNVIAGEGSQTLIQLGHRSGYYDYNDPQNTQVVSKFDVTSGGSCQSWYLTQTVKLCHTMVSYVGKSYMLCYREHMHSPEVTLALQRDMVRIWPLVKFSSVLLLA